MSFEDAAALPMASITALQALRDSGGLKPGQGVLVNGASGGVGTFAAKPNADDLAYVAGLCEAGRLKPVIDKVYPFDDAVAAFRYLEKGHARGKVVIGTNL
jgi:NADPH:quinone reductase-like Zn-dependent oxidoreductase